MKRTLAGAALLAALAGGVAVLRDSKVDPDERDVKQLGAARDAGEAPDYGVFKGERSDGGHVFYGLSRERDGGEKVTFVDSSPCRRRPEKTSPGCCNLRLPDGGERDFGELNTMQAGSWVDRGCCEVTACTAWFEVSR